MSREGEGEGEHVCRICFEGEGEGEDHGLAQLISPCACKGSQKFVHKDCLRQWQVVMVSRRDFTKAYTCSVCKSRYTYPYLAGAALAQAGAELSNLFQYLAWLVSVLFVFPAATVAKLVLFLLGLLSYSGFSIAFIGPDGQPILVRTGALVEGLQSGCLLVASRSMPPTSIFYKAVVLLTDHTHYGSKGVILNKPCVSASANVSSTAAAVSLGGPVDQWAYTCIHNIPLPMSRRLSHSVYLTEGGFPDLNEVTLARNNMTQDSDGAFKSRILQGYSGWGPNRLANEIRAGAWNLLPAAPDRVFGLSQHDMWGALTQVLEGRSDRLEVLGSAANRILPNRSM